jgi:hypothetical protein
MFEPAKLVFIDETCIIADMVRRRSLRGGRLAGYAPQDHRKTTTFVAGRRQRGTTAPGVIDGAINGPMFVGYVEHIFSPAIKQATIVIIAICRFIKLASGKRFKRQVRTYFICRPICPT